MLDNTGDHSEVVADLSTSFASGGGDSFEILRPRLLAQYIGAEGVGGYATIAGAGLVGAGDSNTFKFGNLELGGLYQRAVVPELDIGFRAGVAFHTASDDDLVNPFSLAFSRPADIGASQDAHVLRLAVSPTVHSGIAFARVDFGVDTRLNNDSGHPLGHVNAGVGVGQAQWSAAAEFSVAFPLGDDEGGSIKVAGLSAHYNAETVSPFLSVSHMFDSGGDSTVTNVVAGIAVPLAI